MAAPSRGERERALDAMGRLEHALSRSDAERLAQHALDFEPLPARGWDARLEPPAPEFGYELGLGFDPHSRDRGRDGPELGR